MSTVAFIRQLLAAGLALNDALLAAEVHEAAIAEAPAPRSKGAARQARYQQRLADSGMSPRQWSATSRRIIERDGATCAYCDGGGHMCCDHVEPLIAGGSSEDSNLVAACTDCNREKSGRSVEAWKGDDWAATWRLKRQVTLATFNNAQPPSSPPPSPRPPTTPTPTPAIRATRTRAATRRCPADWLPTAEDEAVGAAEGLKPGEIAREYESFRDHTFGTPRSDWSATYRNWLRRAGREATRRNSTRRPTDERQPSSLDDRIDRYFAASERAVDERAVE